SAEEQQILEKLIDRLAKDGLPRMASKD
ncbi:MarR family transcriptional regulator, partial [Xanthomonas oryzae pv. oryzae]